MARRGDRGGSQTRARIAEVATGLFLERGFDEVTIAEVAAAAGVSKVTVFAHFEHKEDLLLDRIPDAVSLVRRAIVERADDVCVVDAFRRTALDLAEQRHPLSGLSEATVPFLRTLLASPALISRLRAFAYEMEAELEAALHADSRFRGDSVLVAALLVATYRVVAIETAQRLLVGNELADVAATHRRRLEDAFDLLATGLRVDD